MSFNESSLLAKSKRKVNLEETKLWQFAKLALFLPVIIKRENTFLQESNILLVVPYLLQFFTSSGGDTPHTPTPNPHRCLN